VGGALRALRGAGLRLGVCSNTASHALTAHLVTTHGLTAFFDPIVTSASTGRRKPDRRVFARFPEAWGLPAARLAMVGDDAAADVLGGAGTGMRTVWLSDGPGGGPGAERPPATAAVPDLPAAARILLAWAADPA